jgi:membrane protease YdiL (CAAX protease family)
MEQHTTVAKRPFYRTDPFTSIGLLVGVFLLSQLLAVFIIGLYPAFHNWTGAQSTAWLETVPAQFLYVLAAEILSVSMIFWLLKKAGIKRSRIGFVKPKAVDAIYALLTYGVYFIVFIFIFMVASRFTDTGQKQELGFDDPLGQGQLIMTFISLVLLPPIAEEIMFRGFLFSSLRAKMRFRYAVILTSVLFGVAHLQFGSDAPLLWIAAIDTFTLSCFLCYLREKTGRIWPSVFLHATKNLIAFITLYHVYIFNR